MSIFDALQLDKDMVITSDMRKILLKELTQAIQEGNSLKYIAQQEKRKAILAAYKKSVGFDKIIKAIRIAEATLEDAREKLGEVGLSESGDCDVYVSKEKYPERYHKVQEIKAKLDAVYDNSDKVDAHKITMLATVCKTVGQFMTLANDVLGNGYIKPMLEDKSR